MGKNGGRQTLSKEMLEAIAEKAAEIAAAVATNTYQQKVKQYLRVCRSRLQQHSAV